MTRGHSDENKAAGKDLGKFAGMLHTGFAAHFRRAWKSSPWKLTKDVVIISPQYEQQPNVIPYLRAVGQAFSRPRAMELC
jgi:hypothetical protein